MKKLSSFFVACCTAIIAFVFYGCSASSYTEDYAFHFELTSYSGSDPVGDTQKVDAYFAEKNIPVAYIPISGHSLKDCDQQAIALFNESVAKLSYEEIDALNFKGTISFAYTLSRGSDILAQWEYPNK